ncbi:MAG TPA: hypothetical protein DDW31_07315 [candidate division Zixibacteria bacterium]|jgi:tetratricopeptide (TPR) repeat protein|nr:hypothetical protein [candidate division Zixibacteria bacterium]
MTGSDGSDPRAAPDPEVKALRERLQSSSDGSERLGLGLELGRRLAGHGAYDQAIEVIEPLLPLAASEEDRVQVLQQLGQAHLRLSQYQKAYLYLGEALALLSSGPGSVDLFQVYYDLAWMFYRQGYLDNARSYLEGARMALEGLAGLDLSRQRAELLHITALIEASDGNHDQAAAHLREEASFHEKTGDEHRLAAVYNKLSSVTYTRGDIAGALEYQALTHSLSEKTGDSFRLALSHKNFGDIHFIMWDLAGALEHFRRSDELCRSIGNGLGQIFAQAAIGRILAAGRQHSQAKSHFDRALEMARRLENRDREAGVLVDLAEWHCLQSRPEAALDSLKLAEKIEMMRGRTPSPRHQAVLARTLLISEGIHGAVEAQRLLENLLSRPLKLDDEEMMAVPELEAEARFLLARSLLGQGLRDQADAETARAADLVTAMSQKVPDEHRRTFLSKPTSAEILGGKSGQ